jgi:hypothetical protein
MIDGDLWNTVPKHATRSLCWNMVEESTTISIYDKFAVNPPFIRILGSVWNYLAKISG